MTAAEIKEALNACKRFLQYVEEYSDPVEDEPRYVRFKKTIKMLQAAHKAQPTDSPKCWRCKDTYEFMGDPCTCLTPVPKR